jgi:hypothetical protein
MCRPWASIPDPFYSLIKPERLAEFFALYREPVNFLTDPARGLPAFVKFPNLASFREQLERMHDEYDRAVRSAARANQKQLPQWPQIDEAEKARIIEGFRQLKARLAGDR